MCNKGEVGADMKRVLILSSHPLFGKCIENLISQDEGLEIVGYEQDPAQAVDRILKLRPDVVILDSDEYEVNREVVTTCLLKQGVQARVVGLNLNNNTATVCSGEQKIIGELSDFLRTIQPDTTVERTGSLGPAAHGSASAVRDRYGRRFDYLRVSITDRCNLRCVYCMPPEGVASKPREAILHSEEIARVVEAAAGMGFRYVRLTGGEPLVRKGVVGLVRRLAGIRGIEEVALTTNATLLGAYACDLAGAGLKRVNISLDSLQPERFRRITRLGNLQSVWQGIEAAQAAGLSPLKINMVVVRGFNDDEVADLARLSLDHPWHIRFIEVMPVAGVSDWGPGMPPVESRLVSAGEVRQRLQSLGTLIPEQGPGGHGPARYYRLPGAQGTVGFISAMSEHFCATCNRMRLTADGHLRPCLFSDQGVYVKDALADGASLVQIQSLILQAAEMKPERHASLAETAVSGTAMSMIGG